MKYFLSFLLLIIGINYSIAQDIKELSPSSKYGTTSSYSTSIAKIHKKNIHIVCIAVDEFNDYEHFININSSKNLTGIHKASKNIFPLNYAQVHECYLEGHVTTADVVGNLYSISNKVDEESLVIIILSSHGEYKDGEYYFITSDTSTDIPNTAVSGTALRSSFNQMSTKGASVLVFIDTCHAAGIFENKNNSAGICYFASSGIHEKSTEVDETRAFSNRISDIFNSNISNHIPGDFITINSIAGDLTGLMIAKTEEQYKHSLHSNYRYCGIEGSSFGVIKYIDTDKVPFSAKPFIPWSVSQRKGRYFDYSLIAIEGACAISFLSCGITQVIAKNKIKELSVSGLDTAIYRQRGRNAAIGCCVSAGTFLLAYAVKAGHVYYQYELQYREKQQKKMNVAIYPSANYTNAGLTIALNF